MLYLILAVGCSLIIGMIFKYAGQHRMDRIALLTTNYAAAVVLASVLLALGERDASGGLAADGSFVALGITTGALFILGFFMLSLATDVAGMSLAIGVMRVSVVVPFLASWIIWSETPSVPQGVGLLLASMAFFMIARKDNPTAQQAPAAPPDIDDAAQMTNSAGRTFTVLALLFLTSGTIDVFMKTYDEVYEATTSRALFLLMIFGIACSIGLGIVLWRGLQQQVWPQRHTLLWGVALGIVNYGSVEFFLRAIRVLSGPFVFPANHIALVIGAALLGVYVWGEHLSRLNWAGLGLAAVALVLLNM